MTGPFTRQDLDSVTALVVASWKRGIDRDWSVPAGTLEWGCLKTAEHTVDAALAPAFFLVSRRQDFYPVWAAGPILMGETASLENLIVGLQIAGIVLSAVIVAAPPETRAIIRRRPVPTTSDPSDFAPRGALEMILRGHDVCASLRVPFEPPAPLCGRPLEHVRPWSIWGNTPRKPPAFIVDAWGDLLIAAGRARA